MTHRTNRGPTIRILPTASALVAIACLAEAQSLLQTNGQLVAASGGATPGVPGAVWAGNGAFDTPQIDEGGSVYFRGQFTGGGATGADDRAMFHGPAGGLAIMTRNGSQAPGMPAGVTVNTSAGAGGLTSLYRLGPAGASVWLANVWNGGATTTSDTACYGGTPASPLLLGREGDPAVGTVGANYSSNFTTSLSLDRLSVTANGNICWRSLLTGGDVSGTTNNEALYIFDAGTSMSQMLFRKGDLVPGGYSVSTLIGPASPYVLHMNNSGQVFWEAQLNQTIGTPLPTAQDNQVLLLSSLGGGTTIVAREGDVAPGTGGDLFGATSGLSTWAATGNCFAPNGDVLFKSDLKGAGTTAGVNDQAMFFKPAAGPTTLLFRRGDAAPGAPGTTLNTMTNSSMNLNSSGQFVLTMTLAGASTSNDGGIWWGNANVPGSLALLAREGDPAPGTAGALLGSAANVMQNNSGLVVFTYTLTGGDVSGTTNDQALYRWSQATGLVMIARKGETWTAIPGETISSFSFNTSPDTGGTNLSFSNAGRLVTRLGLVSTNQAVAVIDVGGTPYTTFCSGDAVGTTCLGCGNNGSAGRGCGNSVFAAGTQLTSSGFASVAGDTLVLTTTDMPGPGLFFQANGLAGSPITFGDGMLCASVGIIRLGVVFPSPTFTASYPGGLTPFPISIAGAPIGAGDLKHYQCWYRDSAAFCTPSTFNTSSGVSLTWGP